MDHTSIPFQMSMQNAGQLQTMKYQRDRMNDMLKQADEMTKTIVTMQRMYDLMTQLVATTHRMVGDTEEMQQITNELRDRHRGLRRFLAADPQLFLLGEALFRHSDLLVDPTDIRRTRRRRSDHREVEHTRR